MTRLSLALAGTLTASLAGFAWAAATLTVAQKNRAFSVPRLLLGVGDRIVFTNEDEFIHQIFVRDPRFGFDSDEQDPGKSVAVTFPVAGEFVVLCGIHPKMQLAVTVR